MDHDKKRLKKDLHKALKRATREDPTLSGIYDALIEFITNDMVGSVPEGSNDRIEETYEALLENLDEEQEKLFYEYQEAQGELDEYILIEYIKRTAGYILNNWDIITDELTAITEEIKK